MVYLDRKRARGRPSTHNEETDLPPPPPPKRPTMCVKVKHHYLIPPTTIDILLHGWKVKLDDGKYAKTWITDQNTFNNITPPYVPDRFDILGEKLDKAFVDAEKSFPSLTSLTVDLSIGETTDQRVEEYVVPSEESLELRPLFSQDEGSLPPPPPPPPPSVPHPTMEAIGDQLENSQYSPTHVVRYDDDMEIVQNEEDQRYSPSRPTQDDPLTSRVSKQHKTSESSSDYLSADEDFPPPAPSPPSIPNSPAVSPPPPAPPSPKHDVTLRVTSQHEHDVTLTGLQEPATTAAGRRSLLEPPDPRLSRSFRAQRTPDRQNISSHSRTPSRIRGTPSKMQTTPRNTPVKTRITPRNTPVKPGSTDFEMGGPSRNIGDDLTLQPMEVEDEEEMPMRISPELDGVEFDEVQEDEEADQGLVQVEEEQEEQEEEEGIEELDGVEDIDSPDELEDEEEVQESNKDPTPNQISLFREIITDSGEVKRELYFRKSKFRHTGTALSQISKMTCKMDYEDACKNGGFPELLNKNTRPDCLRQALTDRLELGVEEPKKKQPPRPKPAKFGVPLSNLKRNVKFQHSASTAVKMKNFGVPLRQLRGPLLGSQQPRQNMAVTRTFSNNAARPLPTNTAPNNRQTLTRSEQLISEFCACWVSRPFHDARCASMHDNFVEVIMSRHAMKYGLIKECIREYSMKMGSDTSDPVRAFYQFKCIMRGVVGRSRARIP